VYYVSILPSLYVSYLYISSELKRENLTIIKLIMVASKTAKHK